MKFRIVCFILCVFHAITLVSLCQIETFNPFRVNRHVAALILARGGSKGIKLKNLAPINGKTLLANSLQAILKVQGIDNVWVSTDHDEIYREAIKSKLNVLEAANDKVNVHWRSAESATDKATSIFAVQEFLTWRPEIDVLLLVQCTSPFIRHEYLRNALELMVANGVECVFSVTKSFKLRWLRNSNGTVIAGNFDPSNRPRRQDWDGELIENGMFYLAKRNLLERGVFQSQNCKLVEIPERHALEIDSEYHLRLAQHLQLNFDR